MDRSDGEKRVAHAASDYDLHGNREHVAKWLMIVHVVSDAAVSGERQVTSERKYSQVNQLAATQLHEYSSARRPRTSAGTREWSSVNAGNARDHLLAEGEFKTRICQVCILYA